MKKDMSNLSAADHLTLWHRPYKFAGADRPTGTKYCLRDHLGNCLVHGIIFGLDAKKALGQLGVNSEVDRLLRTWDIPVKLASHKIGPMHTCQDRTTTGPTPDNLGAFSAKKGG